MNDDDGQMLDKRPARNSNKTSVDETNEEGSTARWYDLFQCLLV
jgi:hypothetical protein